MSEGTITKTRRHMTEEEEKLVERLELDSPAPVGCHVAFFAVFTIFVAAVGAANVAFFALFVTSNSSADAGFMLRSAGTGAILAAAFMLWLMRESWPQRRYPGLAADRIEADVELVNVHPLGVARIGDVFFFDVGEEKCLVLHGVYLRTELESGRFPNQDFAIVKAPNAGLSLGVECHGDPLAAAEPSGPKIDCTRIPDRALVLAKLATLREDLFVLLTSGWHRA